MRFREAGIGFLALQLFNKTANKKDDLVRQLMPCLEITKAPHLNRFERFGDYVGECVLIFAWNFRYLYSMLFRELKVLFMEIVRQMGFKDVSKWQWLSRFAEEYLKGNGGNSFDSQEAMLLHLTSILTEDEIQQLSQQLIDEIEACIVSYFSFHWDYSLEVLDEVLVPSPQPMTKLRDVVRTAARKHRLERAVKTLRTKNVFSTLVEQLKAMGTLSPIHEPKEIPNNSSKRNPMLLLVGGGMGAGKSSVVKDILKSPLWSAAAKNAVIVEADAFKETDLIYQALSSDGYREMLETSELVHKSSTNAASSLLVAALNEGRDIIFDGTMSWKPFVQQTIAMVRDVHRRRYRMGPGYRIDSEGQVHENYWESIEKHDLDEKPRLPYRVELVGVVCDPSLAVVRGVRRAIRIGRAVDIRKQLMSHRMFGDAFLQYCELVDQVRLYRTNKIKHSAELLGVKEINNKMLVNAEGVRILRKLSILNPNATSVLDLYNKEVEAKDLDQGWKDIVLDSQRSSQKKILQAKIQRIQSLLLAQRVLESPKCSANSDFNPYVQGAYSGPY